MRDANGGVGLVDVLAAGARGAVGVDAKIRGIQYDVADRARLGQDGDRAGRGMDASLRLGGGHSLDAMAAGLEFELGVGTMPDHARDDLLVPARSARRFRYHLHLPALAVRIGSVHAKHVAREGRRCPAGAGVSDRGWPRYWSSSTRAAARINRAREADTTLLRVP